MTPAEYDIWQRVMRNAAGRWTEDQIMTANNPYSRRLWFRPSELRASVDGNVSDGLFIELYCPSDETRPGPRLGVGPATIRAGYYEGATPHIGEALFHVVWGVTLLDGFDAGLKLIHERIRKRI